MHWRICYSNDAAVLGLGALGQSTGGVGPVRVSAEAQPGPAGGEADGPRVREHFLRTPTSRVTMLKTVFSVSGVL